MKIDAKKFSQAFQQVAPLAGKRSTMPILSTVLISCQDGLMRLSTSCIEASGTATFECDGTIEPFCAPVDAIGRIMAGAGDREVELSLAKGNLHIEVPFRVKIPVLPGKDFPPLPVPQKSEYLGINCEDLANAIRAVAWAADAKASETDIWRAAVQIKTTTKSIICAGTDGKSCAHWESGTMGVDSEVLIPCQFAPLIADVISGENADYCVSQNHVFGVSNSLTVAIQRYNANYPNVSEYVNGNKIPIGEVDTKKLINELQLCVSVVNPGGAHTRCQLTFSETGLLIYAIENGREFESSVDGKFSTFARAFNAVLLIDMLRHMGSEKAMVSAIGESAMATTAGDLVCLTVGLFNNPTPEKNGQ